MKYNLAPHAIRQYIALILHYTVNWLITQLAKFFHEDNDQHSMK